MIGGFGWVDLVILATSTVRLWLTDYSSTEWLTTNKAANAPIKFEEIVMVMITNVIST